MREFVGVVILIGTASAFSANGATGSESEGRRVIRLAVGGGWAWAGMTSINDGYIDQVAQPFGDFEDHLTGGPDIVVEGTCSWTPRLALGLAVAYLGPSIKGESLFEIIDEDGTVIATCPLENNLETRLIAPEILGSCALLRGTPDVSVVLAGGWGFGRAIRTTKVTQGPDCEYEVPPTERDEWQANGLSLRLALRGSARLAGPFSLAIEAGYRYAETGALTSGAGDQWQVETAQGDRAMDLDFTGPYLHCAAAVTLPR